MTTSTNESPSFEDKLANLKTFFLHLDEGNKDLLEECLREIFYTMKIQLKALIDMIFVQKKSIDESYDLVSDTINNYLVTKMVLRDCILSKPENSPNEVSEVKALDEVIRITSNQQFQDKIRELIVGQTFSALLTNLEVVYPSKD